MKIVKRCEICDNEYTVGYEDTGMCDDCKREIGANGTDGLEYEADIKRRGEWYL